MISAVLAFSLVAAIANSRPVYIDPDYVFSIPLGSDIRELSSSAQYEVESRFIDTKMDCSHYVILWGWPKDSILPMRFFVFADSKYEIVRIDFPLKLIKKETGVTYFTWLGMEGAEYDFESEVNRCDEEERFFN